MIVLYIFCFVYNYITMILWYYFYVYHIMTLMCHVYMLVMEVWHVLCIDVMYAMRRKLCGYLIDTNLVLVRIYILSKNDYAIIIYRYIT